MYLYLPIWQRIDIEYNTMYPYEDSLINRIPKDFFDMIIIEEAHHSPAKTWVETTNYFNNSKVIKITGTPFRSDDEAIVGEMIYRYRLGAAMANG